MMNGFVRRHAIALVSLTVVFLLISLLKWYLAQGPTQPHPADSPTTVVSVVDGDTIIISPGQVEIDLAYLDTPKLPLCGSTQAKERLEALVLGKEVHIERVSDDTAQRVLAIVLLPVQTEGVDPILINAIMMREGMVRYDDTLEPIAEDLRAANQQAQQGKVGIYGTRCRSEIPDINTCTIKGDINRQTGEKQFYIPGCIQYDDIIVEKDLGEQWFCGEKQAQDAGYLRSSTCPPPAL